MLLGLLKSMQGHQSAEEQLLRLLEFVMLILSGQLLSLEAVRHIKILVAHNLS